MTVEPPPPPGGTFGSPAPPAPPLMPQGAPMPPPGASFGTALPDPPPGYVNPQWGYPVAAPRPPQKPPLNGFAVAALIVGLIGGIGLSIVLGVVALIQIRRKGQRGKPLAIIGIALSLVWVLVIVGVYFVFARTTAVRGPDGKPTQSGQVLVTDLQTGDCLEKWTPDIKSNQVTLVPCTTKHAAQVFKTFTVAGTTFPGDRQLTAAATKDCLAAVKTALKPGQEAKAKIGYFRPPEASWKDGHHDVVCVAVSNTPGSASILK
jgi:hypothetical protein